MRSEIFGVTTSAINETLPNLLSERKATSFDLNI
jgi:hypothetical protein